MPPYKLLKVFSFLLAYRQLRWFWPFLHLFFSLRFPPILPQSYFSRNVLVADTGEVTGSVWSLSSFPRPPSAWTRLERIPHLAVYGKCLGKTACIRWHVTSHYLPLLA